MKISKPTSTSTLTPQYLLAGSFSAVLGDAVAFPLDTIKVRMQANPARSVKGAWTAIIREGGIACIFRGIGASAFRQSTYGGTRMFLYTPICNAISSQATTSGLHVQLCAGALSGLVASAIFCPTDVIKIRMQTRLDYKGILDAFSSIVRTEGPQMLWRGVGPTSTRAAVVAAAELGTYDAVKSAALQSSHSANFPTAAYALASIVATFVSVIASYPIDTAKTIMINQGLRGAQNTYRNMGHCIWARFHQLGPLGVYRGCMPSLSRSLVCNVVLFLSHEHIRNFVVSCS